MPSFYADHEDLRWHVEKGIDWKTLFELTERGATDGYGSVEEAVGTWREVLELVGTFAAEEIAPYALEIDREGVLFDGRDVRFPPRLEGVFRQMDEMGLHGMCLPRELGGMNCPLLVYMLSAEVLARADVSAMAHFSFHGGIAMALLVYSIYEGTTTFDPATGAITGTRFRDAILEMSTGAAPAGRAWGSMDITEPQAGSDMAALRSRAVERPDGSWAVSGEKVFITSGHGRWHIVIARTEEPKARDAFAGLEGLSLFLVPAWSEDAARNRIRHVHVDRVEEKLGHHGSATCALSFDEAPAHLLGKRGEGFRQMLLLMNNARIGVAFEAIGLCEAAYRLARSYAVERTSMGKTLDRHEIPADWLDEMRTDLEGMRALTVRAAWNEEVSRKQDLVRIASGQAGRAPDAAAEAARKEAARVSRRLTPLAKYLAAEKAVEMARRCVQLHGGSGYMREVGAEKLLRDAMVMPIYEGTSQIQALMVMKDTLTGLMKRPQDLVRRQAENRLRAAGARDPLERGVHRLHVASLKAQQSLLVRTAASKMKDVFDRPLAEWLPALRSWDPKRDFSRALLHAEHLTRLLADEAVAEVLLDESKRHPERRDVLARWLERAEPRSRHLLDLVLHSGDRLLRDLASATPNRPPG